MQAIMKMNKKKDQVEDSTLKKAKENIDAAETVLGDVQLYEETQFANFEEK